MHFILFSPPSSGWSKKEKAESSDPGRYMKRERGEKAEGEERKEVPARAETVFDIDRIFGAVERVKSAALFLFLCCHGRFLPLFPFL